MEGVQRGEVLYKKKKYLPFRISVFSNGFHAEFESVPFLPFVLCEGNSFFIEAIFEECFKNICYLMLASDAEQEVVVFRYRDVLTVVLTDDRAMNRENIHVG